MSSQQKKQPAPQQQHQMPQADSPTPADYSKVGPRSIEGVEASDLPDKGRGPVETNLSKEAARKLPQQTGQRESGDTGLRGDPDIADASDHGHRKHS